MVYWHHEVPLLTDDSLWHWFVLRIILHSVRGGGSEEEGERRRVSGGGRRARGGGVS
jgi:hypothetical protein